jgi:hypothetical protein
LDVPMTNPETIRAVSLLLLACAVIDAVIGVLVYAFTPVCEIRHYAVPGRSLDAYIKWAKRDPTAVKTYEALECRYRL